MPRRSHALRCLALLALLASSRLSAGEEQSEANAENVVFHVTDDAGHPQPNALVAVRQLEFARTARCWQLDPHRRLTDAEGRTTYPGLSQFAFEYQVTAPGFQPSKTVRVGRNAGPGLIEVVVRDRAGERFVRGHIRDVAGRPLGAVQLVAVNVARSHGSDVRLLATGEGIPTIWPEYSSAERCDQELGRQTSGLAPLEA